MARLKLNRPPMPVVADAKKLGSGEQIGDDSIASKINHRLKRRTSRCSVTLWEVCAN